MKKEKRKKETWTWLLPSSVEVEMWESIGRGRDSNIWESPAWTEPDWAVPRGEKGEGGREREEWGKPGAAAKKPKGTKRVVGLCREEQPSLWAGEFSRRAL